MAEKKNENKQQRNEKGQFVKGCKKVGGRQPGTKNKYGNVRDRLKDIIMPYLQDNLDDPKAKSLAKDLMAIADPNDRVHAVAAILPYIVPKYTATTITADANRPVSEEERLNELDKLYTKKEVSISIKAMTIVDNDIPQDMDDFDPDEDPDFNLEELR